MALISHYVSYDSFFAFENNWLFKEIFVTVIYYIYNLYGPMLITSNEIVDTISEKKNIYIYAKYGIHVVTDPFTINSENLFR